MYSISVLAVLKILVDWFMTSDWTKKYVVHTNHIEYGVNVYHSTYALWILKDFCRTCFELQSSKRLLFTTLWNKALLKHPTQYLSKTAWIAKLL